MQTSYLRIRETFELLVASRRENYPFDPNFKASDISNNKPAKEWTKQKSCANARVCHMGDANLFMIIKVNPLMHPNGLDIQRLSKIKSNPLLENFHLWGSS